VVFAGCLFNNRQRKLLIVCCSRDAKLLVPAKNIGSLINDVGYIKNVSCNATGTKVSFVMIKVQCSQLHAFLNVSRLFQAFKFIFSIASQMYSFFSVVCTAHFSNTATV